MKVKVTKLKNNGVGVIVNSRYHHLMYQFLDQELEQATIPHEYAHGFGMSENVPMIKKSLFELPYSDFDFIARKICERFSGKTLEMDGNKYIIECQQK